MAEWSNASASKADNPQGFAGSNPALSASFSIRHKETMSDSFAKGITWDLSDLYLSPEDVRLEEDLTLAETKAADFERKYKPLFQAGKNGTFPLFDLLT